MQADSLPSESPGTSIQLIINLCVLDMDCTFPENEVLVGMIACLTEAKLSEDLILRRCRSWANT